MGADWWGLWPPRSANSPAVRRAPLVSRNEVRKAKDAFDGFLQAEIRAGAGVALVALHQRAPLAVAHGAGARVGEQVNKDVARSKAEQVVVGFGHDPFSFGARDALDRFDGLDAERLGGIEGHARLLAGWLGSV